MKTKVVASVAAFASWLFSVYYASLSIVFVVGISAAYFVYGLAVSTRSHLDLLNDAPNALRVFLAAVAGYLFTQLNFLDISVSVALFMTSILLNDEYQRRVFAALRSGRVGGSLALLGIDGSGKSTHASALAKWLTSRGYHVSLLPFHRYIIVERLARRKVNREEAGSRGGGNPLRPLLSVFDNLLLLLSTSFGRGIEGRVVIYDRYIWSTYVKYKALGYPVRPLRWLYFLPRPKVAVLLDIPVSKSLGVIHSRRDHIRYRRAILEEERMEYLSVANKIRCHVIDATGDFEAVQRQIEGVLADVFPGGALR